VAGHLTDRGGYPALLPPSSGDQRVEGELLRLRDPKFLAELDDYEGEEYLRDRIEVQTPGNGKIETWVYIAAKPGQNQADPNL